MAPFCRGWREMRLGVGGDEASGKQNEITATLAQAAATVAGIGYFPAGPGTVGSAAALGAAYVMAARFCWQPFHFGVLALAVAGPAIAAATSFSRRSAQKDPSCVVVDEVVGQWITLAGASTLNWKSWAAAFVLFRVFDIVKPWPARRLESLPGGWGIVADDVMAGVYAAVVMLLAGWCKLY